MPASTTTLFPTRDVAKSKEIFTSLLEVEPYVDTPYYVGYQLDGQEIGLVPNGHDTGMTGPVKFWDVEDIAETVARLEVAGATVVQAPHPVGGGMQVATLADADGNQLGLRQHP